MVDSRNRASCGRRPDDPAGGDFYDEVMADDEAGQADLAAALAGTLAAHHATVAEQQQQINQLESTELASVGHAVATARGQVGAAVAAAQRAVSAAGTATQRDLAARHATQQTEAAALVTEGADRVRQSGATRGDEAVGTAGNVASGVRTTVDGQAGQAQQRGTAKLRTLSGESGESTTAMRRAAGEVADQTAGQIRDSLGNTEDPPVGFTWTIDTTGPGVVVSSPVSSPTNSSPIPITITPIPRPLDGCGSRLCKHS